jgi:predicted DNA binding CopG/RHH family protein
MKAIQYFSDQHLDQCRELTTDQILRFLSDFQQLHTQQRTRTKLISIKGPEDLLGAFRTRAELAKVPYQTQIKKLMQQWALDFDR